MMKRYKLTEDETLSPVPQGDALGGSVEARPLAAFGLFSEDGKFVGLDIQDLDPHTPYEHENETNGRIEISDEEKAAAEQEFLARQAKHKPLPLPEGGKPFNPESIPDLKLSEQEFLEFQEILESFRKPEPWSNPWDLP